MKEIEIKVTESDIERSIKNTRYSPLEYALSRVLKENTDNVEAQKTCILIWNNDDSDYISYRYCDEYIEKIRLFLEEWEDFKDNISEEFCGSPFVFCIFKTR